jgi:transcriptional regulator with XRE-family HTH domain
MGVRRRMPVKKLPEKLRHIRKALGLTQTDLISQLAAIDNRITSLDKSNISRYEKGDIEPPIPVLLAYARIANVCMEQLADPGIKLPDKLPRPKKHNSEN